ncbi:MAG: TIGR00159 family protein [Elusimicrobia bacterium]|nr:TIGR00159 family protein [Elusimicrobiota bacterium]
MTFLGHLWSQYLVHLLDIGLVAFLLYRLMLLIKGTRAVQVLLGIAMLLGITIVVRDLLRLRTLTWLLDNFWGGAAIILAVVFQPELRGLLAQLGAHPLNRILIPQEAGFIDEIVAALREASERRIGMLIVLEQETGLRNYIETGTPINGEVTHELLLSLFNVRSPLHDGAVIVEQGRLVAAACLLPLSLEPGLAKILGTRHRAAVGLSEISDALVLVVSEETGIISLARGGRLQRGLDPEELREQLTELFRAAVRQSLLRHRK